MQVYNYLTSGSMWDLIKYMSTLLAFPGPGPLTQDVAQDRHHCEGLELGGARTQRSGWLTPMTQEPLEKLLISYNGSAEAEKCLTCSQVITLHKHVHEGIIAKKFQLIS